MYLSIYSILFISFLLITELLFYNVLRNAFPSKSFFLFYIFFTTLFISISAYLISNILTSNEKNRWKRLMQFTSFFTLIYLPKILIALLSLLEKTLTLISLTLFKQPLFEENFIAKIILFFALIPFFGVIHGIFIGRYKFKVIKKTLFFDNLPDTFNDLSLLQISDIHSGSLSKKSKILKGIELINKLNADLIVFTGDLINSHPHEMDDWIEIFAQIKRAPLGNYSILGNHDYGGHQKQIKSIQKETITTQLKDIHQKIGFELLLNENRVLKKDGYKINLLGVENYGAPPFPQYGDLEKTVRDINHNDFNILLSHDPSHFDLEVKNFEKHIPLTLSGHTHGMQFGIEFFKFKWSPVKYKYPKWAGLYEENDRFLYVNRGFGYIGLPARIGIWPEITLLTLKKKL